MISTSPLDGLPTTTSLVDHAHALGIRVWWTGPPGQGRWSQQHRSIWLDGTLTCRRAKSLLAHELGHAFYGDDGPQPEHLERRAWRYAAWLLLTDRAYAHAERLYGHRAGALADALDVTDDVIHAYRDLRARSAA